MITCRLLPHTSGDGPANMALDEAILDLVAEDPELAIVRTYEWSVPTLSLGYFQASAAVAADPRWAGRALVRRPTGGGALWHEHEITYALAVPAAHPLARPSTALYGAIHEAIAAQLRALGIAAARRGSSRLRGDTGSERPLLCFRDQDDNDVVAGAVKLVGSAQRRRGGAVLQHGSLLLARSATTPELPGLRELDRRDDPAFWAHTLRELLPAAIGSTAFTRELSNSEQGMVDQIRNDVYLNPAWTNRR